MFVIGRALHEQIQIGNSITIKVLRIGDKHVTLGIDAPKAVPLSRESHSPDSAPFRAGGSPSGCDLSVLIVDDTPIHTWLIQKAFTAYGADHTKIARSGAEALGLLGLAPGPAEKVSQFNLVVMELRLPDMPGIELIRRIRSARELSTLAIVVMSYQDADTEVLRCLEAGANAFVPKPETQEGFRQNVFRLADFWGHARLVTPATAGVVTEESVVC
ncbi:MAG TPA: response regulator [Phycisphaerae bacterium]|nr:response regulator [Phycisphaerae bacterium]HOJ74889.1 response regulator [Phycisphaerae bacterium]HOM52052.1 response regulator [Phycisphaerae bacterium]HON64902.1 response regulator [Phycisphaerae bacterium]HOQ87778.1 response regulator [Phycisphaerae bacterium]